MYDLSANPISLPSSTSQERRHRRVEAGHFAKCCGSDVRSVLDRPRHCDSSLTGACFEVYLVFWGLKTTSGAFVLLFDVILGNLRAGLLMPAGCLWGLQFGVDMSPCVRRMCLPQGKSIRTITAMQKDIPMS